MNSLFPLAIALLSNGIAQILKPIFLYAKTKRFDIHQCIACGGFPSSHSSTVTALSMTIGLCEGFTSTYFAICAIFSFIVIYDACNVRYYAGKNIELTKQLIDDLKTDYGLVLDEPIYRERIKTVLGHKYIEVIGGIVLGIIVSIISYLVIIK